MSNTLTFLLQWLIWREQSAQKDGRRGLREACYSCSRHWDQLVFFWLLFFKESNHGRTMLVSWSVVVRVETRMLHLLRPFKSKRGHQACEWMWRGLSCWPLSPHHPCCPPRAAYQEPSHLSLWHLLWPQPQPPLSFFCFPQTFVHAPQADTDSTYHTWIWGHGLSSPQSCASTRLELGCRCCCCLPWFVWFWGGLSCGFSSLWTMSWSTTITHDPL